jgi:hypothetical protein
LEEAMRRENEMENFMIKSEVDPEIILGKVQRQIIDLSLSSQVPCTSKVVEERGVGRGIFQEKTPNVTNISADTQNICQDTHISQLKRIVSQMQNEIDQLKKNDDQSPRKEYQNPPFAIDGLINYPERNQNINDQAKGLQSSKSKCSDIERRF